MDELRPGLRRWTAFHPEWKEDVGCVAVDTDDGLVLIDPLAPPADLPPAAHVLITVYWHTRDTSEVLRRTPDARVWAASGSGSAAVGRRTGLTDAFRPDDPLPGGIEAFRTARGSEVVYWLPQHRALVPGDVILGAEGGGLRLCPRSWLSEKMTLEDLAESLRPLLDLPVTRVLVSHGEPVLTGGRAALERALAPS